MIRLLCCLLALVAWVDAAAGQAALPPVEYTVGLRQAQTQMVEIAMTLRGVQGPTVEVSLPIWRPGRYQVLDPAADVRDVVAKSGRGAALACEKIDKSAWVVRTDAAAGDAVVTVSYRIYCNALADRMRHADDTHAFLSPAGVFMYAPEFREQPLRLRLVAPPEWQVATGLEPDPADPSWLVAPDYDTLVDSPLEVGIHDTINFDVDGVPHQIAIWTGNVATPKPDRAKLIEDLTKMIRAERDVFGEFPYKRYIFLMHLYPGGSGGTEHLNSTVVQTGPQAFATPESTRRFIGLLAHEYFHTWNIKQLRPAGLKPYDYQHENYTDLLWVAEGTTSYMDQVCLVRAGLTRPDDYLRSLGNAIDAFRNRPGAEAQTLSQSSFDAWIRYGRRSPDDINSGVSFYDKGSLVSLLLDMEIRARSENKASLDTLMRNMYLAYPLSGPGYTTRDLMRQAERLTLGPLDQFFAGYVDGLKPLDFETALAAAGLEVRLEPPDAGDGGGRSRRGGGATRDAAETKPEGPKDEAAADAPPSALKARAYIGLNLENRDGQAMVASVLADGPAYGAGVIAGDVVQALNGQRVRPGELDTLLKRLKPGESVKLSLFRYDAEKVVEFKAEGRPDARWTVRRVKAPTEAQKAVYQSWLGQPWPGGKDLPAPPAEPAAPH